MPSSGHQRHSSRNEEADDEEFSSEEEEAQPYSSSSPRQSAHHSKASGSIRSPVVSPPRSGNPVQMPSGGSSSNMSPAQRQWELHAVNIGRTEDPWEPHPAAMKGFAPKEKTNKKGKTKNTGPTAWRMQKTKSGTNFLVHMFEDLEGGC